jgi:hypothetical protein
MRSPKSIDAAALEQSLALVPSHAAGSEAGVFGPNSQIWKGECALCGLATHIPENSRQLNDS